MHYATWLCDPTRPQHTLQMFANHCGPRQTILWETINQGQLRTQRELYPIQTIFNHRSRDQLLEFRTSFYEIISSEFLVQENFKHTHFSRKHWNWRDSNSRPLVPKASAILIELTWLLKKISRLSISYIIDQYTVLHVLMENSRTFRPCWLVRSCHGWQLVTSYIRRQRWRSSARAYTITERESYSWSYLASPSRPRSSFPSVSFNHALQLPFLSYYPCVLRYGQSSLAFGC